MKNSIYFFICVLFNVVYMSIVGWLTLGSQNILAHIAGFIIAAFVALLANTYGARPDTKDRIVNYGSGLIIYLILGLVVTGVEPLTMTLFIPAVLTGVFVLATGVQLPGRKVGKDYLELGELEYPAMPLPLDDDLYV